LKEFDSPHSWMQHKNPWRQLFYYITLTKKKKKLKLIMVLLFQFLSTLIHLNCGGNEYFMVFIDDFSKYNYVYLIKDKSDEFERFKEFFQ
jgi:hypothetical protein